MSPDRSEPAVSPSGSERINNKCFLAVTVAEQSWGRIVNQLSQRWYDGVFLVAGSAAHNRCWMFVGWWDILIYRLCHSVPPLPCECIVSTVWKQQPQDLEQHSSEWTCAIKCPKAQGSLNPSCRRGGPSIWPWREERGRQTAGVITNSSQQEANGGKQWSQQWWDYVNPTPKTRPWFPHFGLKMSEATKHSCQVAHLNSSCFTLLSSVIISPREGDHLAFHNHRSH